MNLALAGTAGNLGVVIVFKKLTVGLLAVGLASVLGACGGNGESTTPETSNSPMTTATQTAVAPADLASGLVAIENAQREVPDSVVIALYYRSDRGHWEVDSISGANLVRVEFTGDGSVVDKQRERPAEQGQIDRSQAATISITDAINTAAGQAGNAEFIEAQLLPKDDLIVWQVSFAGPIEIMVDAATGEIVA